MGFILIKPNFVYRGVLDVRSEKGLQRYYNLMCKTSKSRITHAALCVCFVVVVLFSYFVIFNPVLWGFCEAFAFSCM